MNTKLLSSPAIVGRAGYGKVVAKICPFGTNTHQTKPVPPSGAPRHTSDYCNICGIRMRQVNSAMGIQSQIQPKIGHKPAINLRQVERVSEPKIWQSSMLITECLHVADNDADSYGVVDWVAGVGDISGGVVLRSQSSNQNSTKRKLHQTVHPTPKQSITSSPCSNRPRSQPEHDFSDTKRSALRRHCDYWDTDQDGLIYPWDIFIGFRKLGFNIALCLWAAVTMPICSSYASQTSWIPHPMLVINLNNIHHCRHGSTTGAYDLDADLDMTRFDAIFCKYAEGNVGAPCTGCNNAHTKSVTQLQDYLTRRTLYNLWRGQCCANDFFGWFAGGLEWIAMYILLWPRDGRLHKEDIRGVYNGTKFWEIAEARAAVKSTT